MNFEANKESLSEHKIPKWFNDAKLGIFIHWGLYSVPAYAPIEYGDVTETVKRGREFHFSHNPYSEWYCNSLKLEGPYQEYHRNTFGENFTYDNFVPQFNEDIKSWNPDEWVQIFKKIHAKYVVITTKHHDGFLLWPSKFSNPEKENYTANRDLIGELTESVKLKGLKMGLYYSSLFDWSLQPIPISNNETFINNGPDTPEYAKYVDKHWYELIDKYNPDILWSDIGYPPDGNSEEIKAYFYNKKKEGVVNDRWRKISMKVKEGERIPIPHCDYRTPEYRTYPEPTKFKFEVCRGIGRSFGYNRFETDKHHISIKDLIHLFVDIVSKNGNLLLNIGPTSKGKIPDYQLNRLLGLGEWLDINGEAIFSTKPWIKAEGKTVDNVSIKFTEKENNLYVIVLGIPDHSFISIKDVKLDGNSKISLLGVEGDLEWTDENNGITLKLPAMQNLKHAITLKITPKP